MLLFSCMCLLHAQNNEKTDTVPVLKYELDTTTVPTLAGRRTTC